MRVLLAHQPIDGGVGRHVADLFEGLTEQGLDVVVAGPAPPNASLTLAEAAIDSRHEPLVLQRAVSPRVDARAVADFARLVRRVKPDVVHAHSSKAGAVARAARLLRPGPPVLYTPHGFAFAGFFQRSAEQRAYRLVERALGVLTTRLIAVCEAEARLARQVISSQRIRVVHNGIVDPAEGRHDPIAVGLARRGPLICSVAQLRPGKGTETLLDALPSVLAAHPDVQVIIVGDGPQRDELLTRAARLGVSSAVHLIGEHPAPVEVLRASRMFVLTSWAEAFPYVVLEAMAAGLPIVSSDVGGVAEAITDGTSGMLVAPRDPAATAAAIRRLLDDPAGAAAMGGAAQRRLREEFTRERMVSEIAATYREVLDAP